MTSPHDETQPIPRVRRPGGQPLPGMAPPEPGTVPRSAWRGRAGTRARRAAPRRSRGPRSVAAAIGRAPATLARAVVARWDDIWPPVVGIFLGSLLAAIALVIVFSVWLNLM